LEQLDYCFKLHLETYIQDPEAIEEYEWIHKKSIKLKKVPMHMGVGLL
jgi:hypothetical protein